MKSPAHRLGAACRFLLALTALVAFPGAPARLSAETPGLVEQIEADGPVAWWRFDGEDALDDKVGKVELVPGPSAADSHTLPPETRSVRFFGDGGRLEVEDREDLRFDHGDSITIEAWVQIDEGGRSGLRYVVGKGRSTSGGVNQNWALRAGGSGLSFLFRSRPDGEHEGDYHRWNSGGSIPSDDKWHHVALTYTFGEPKSVKGYIDGKAVSGRWDMGGETTHAPVVDDDVVIIGSSRAGAAGNSFHGAIGELAIHRKALSGKRLAQRYERVVPEPIPPQLTLVDPDEVLVEIRETGANPEQWPDLDGMPDETFPLAAFSLTSLPQVYNDIGVRRDRKLPLHLRFASRVELPPGKHTLLLRAPGRARLLVEGETVAEVEHFRVGGGAHGKLRPQPEEDPYPRPRLGTREVLVELEGGGSFLIQAETMVGASNRRLSVNEFLVAAQYEGSGFWHLLHPGDTEPVPFDTANFAALTAAQRNAFTKMENERRRAAAQSLADTIAERHRQARDYLASIEPVALPPGADPASPPQVVDSFLLAKVETAQRRERENPDAASPEHAEVVALLESECYRCHGEKSKGDLKLDSREAALAAGESGLPAVVPGDPDESELLYRVATDDTTEVMPPKGDSLSKDQVELVRRWIADGAPWASRAATVNIPDEAEPLMALRRLHLAAVGVPPTPAEARAFLAAPAETRVAETVDRLLADPRHADHWVSYWQDVLAENPRLIKPVFNNSGPFRYWLHESLLDNKPMDQFVAELVTFEGSVHGGGAGGFSRAAENDVPMAAKAHVVGTAFLGVEMKCARCHDSPYHSTTQEDLFSLAALLEGEPVTLPESSTVPPAFFEQEGKDDSVVKVTLQPGTAVDPKWPFPDLGPGDASADGTGGIDVAWEIVRPENERFARVVVNRVWKRYFGEGFVEPTDDWEGNPASHPELLDYLGREFVASGYDMQHLSRIILNTEAFRREARFAAAATPDERFFEAPLRKRLTAEQLVDSLFHASGVPNYSEELTFDIEGTFPPQNFLNLGFPRRAWEMVTTASDRDRPSLTLPKADSILAVMTANGWRDARPEPLTERVNETNVIQPGMLANGLMGIWTTRLSDYSDLTGLAIEAESPGALVEDLYLRFLTRLPSEEEKSGFVALLEPGFESRLVTAQPDFRKRDYIPEVREISWTNHLSVAANELASDIEARAYEGPPPTEWIESDWRERMEDLVWALVNAPDFSFVP
ncbi:MAG: DUF1553 domain-containing protein [Verrucomicrobiales bacterium]